MRANPQTLYADDAAIALQCLNELKHDYVAACPASPRAVGGAQGHVVDCPVCATPMTVIASQPLPTIVEMDCATHRLGCYHCGMRTDRIFHCDFGYAPFPV